MTPTDAATSRWRRLLLVVAAVNIVVMLVIQVLLAGAVIPPLLLFLLLYAVAIGLVRRPGKAGPIMVGVVSILFVLTSLPFIVEDVSHPASFLAFSTTLAGLVASVVGVLAMVGFLRGWPSASAAQVGVVALVVIVLGVGLSVVSSLFVSNQAAEGGDVVLKASEVEFKPDMARARAGRVSVHVGNEDLSRHTFTIDALDVDLEVPAGKSRRVEFSAQPGTYDFTCEVSGHEDMKGTLTVE
ncbi:MAG: cupredoxin domain-containing protein [Actinomycetota bacterium]|nr:cupredoxin domain-containing protein [Actinomycetota bacterium]MDQ3680317.1 cupredoxin domain-containing protein [Actinomycetota bacterium]